MALCPRPGLDTATRRRVSQEPNSTVLDIRIYRIQPGKAAEFDRLVQSETVPLARSFGHLVVDFGPSIEDSDVYFLVRSFPTRDERKVALERLYGSAEWSDRYDARVSQMLVSYETVVVAASEAVVAAWTSSTET
jgi:hypothetical protein